MQCSKTGKTGSVMNVVPFIHHVHCEPDLLIL